MNVNMSCPPPLVHQVQTGEINHPSESVELLKSATDSRTEGRDSVFIRGSTMENGTLVQILGEEYSDAGTKYYRISTGNKLVGYVKADNIKMQ